MASKQENVLGFQFEPKISKASASKSYEILVNYDLSDEENTDVSNELRSKLKVSEWCYCDQCTAMTKEVEYVCCHELESANYFKLGKEDNGTHLRIKAFFFSIFWQ